MMKWPAKRLGDLTDVLSGFAFDSEGFTDSDGLPLVRIRDVVPGITSTYFRGAYDSRYLISNGDILIGMDGEFNRARWFGGKALLNQRVCRIASSSRDLDESYLFYYLPAALKVIEDATPFVTVKHLSVKQIRDIAIPLPPLPEQRRIAEILDKADALRDKRRAALAQLDTLTQSIFLDMFGDPATNPKGWPMGRIGDLLESAAYGTSEKAGMAGEYPVLRMNNISYSGEMDFTDLKYMELSKDKEERYLVRKGDILFNRTNSADLVGKTAIFRDDKQMAYAGYLIRLRVKRGNDPEYLAAFLNTPYSKRVLRGMCKSIIGMANINATEVQAIRVAVPDSGCQRQFAKRVTATEELKAIQRKGLEELNSVFASLQYRAFQGKL
jgi:type I restriction enzyme, S subunit